MTWNPLKANHSLDAVVWRVALSDPLIQQHQRLIEAREQRLIKLLPRKEVLQRLVELGTKGVREIPAGLENDSNAPAMLIYGRCAPNGQLELQLEVNGPTLTVVNHNYSRWEKTNRVVRSLLADVGASLREVKHIPIAQLELVYKDVFWWDATWRDGALGELLQPSERWAPAWIFKAGSFWHSDNGMVVEVEGEAMVERMLLQTQDGTVDTKPCRLLVVESIVKWLGSTQQGYTSPMNIQFAFANTAAPDSDESDVSDESGAQARFDIMHQRAAHMLRTVLRPNMRERIGMTRRD